MQLTIGLIQTSLHWEQPEENRAHFDTKIDSLKHADLIVLPEMFSTGFSMASEQQAESMEGETVRWLQQKAEQLNTGICGSVIIKDQGEYFNRFVFCQPGQPAIHYDKRHLFRMANEHDHYSPGEDRVIVDRNGFRICLQVCYDLRFPVFSRNFSDSSSADGDYDLLLYVANWPAARRHHWRTLLTARAIENQSYAVGLNRIGIDGNGVEYSGDSGIVNPEGEWIADLTDVDCAESFTLDLAGLKAYREKFPAWQDADDFSVS